MAKQDNMRVTGIRPSSWAMVNGVFASVIGLAAAVLFSLRTSVDYVGETDSVLTGLTFGLASGAVAIIVVPLVYFGIGWVIGLVQGHVFNYVLSGSGGLVVTLEDNRD